MLINQLYIHSLNTEKSPQQTFPTSSNSQSTNPEKILQLFEDKSFRRALKTDQFEKEHLMVYPASLNLESILEARSRRLNDVFPSPTGCYARASYGAIGHTQFIIQIPKILHSITDEQIGVEIYTPTRKTSSGKLPISPTGYTDVRKNIYLEHVLSSEQKGSLHSHSQDSLCLETKMPVVVFSHRLEGDPTDYRALLEEIASHGYIVISLNHPSSSRNASFSEHNLTTNKLPPGGRRSKEFMTEVTKLTLIQASNIGFIVNQIREGTLQELSSLGPLNHIVLAGHSIGGAASVIASRNDPNISGCINLDGGLLGDQKTEGISMPVLTLLSKSVKKTDANYALQQQITHDFATFHRNSPRSTQEKIERCTHYDFESLPAMLFHLIGKKPPSGSLQGALQTHKEASRKIMRFLKKDSFPKSPRQPSSEKQASEISP